MKKLAKRWVSMFLTVSLVWVTSISSYAQNASYTPGDVAGELMYIEQLLNTIGLSMNDIENLPQKGNAFYAEMAAVGEQLINEAIAEAGQSPRARSTGGGLSIPSTQGSETLAERLDHAEACAKWNIDVMRDPGAKGNYNRETVYMFLSHYIDLDMNNIGSAADANDDKGYYSNYIVEDDRKNYDIFIYKLDAITYGNALFECFTVIKDLALTPGAVDEISAMSKALAATISQVGTLGVDATIMNDVTKSMLSLLSGSQSSQALVEGIYTQLGPQPPSVSKAAIGLAFTAIGWSVGLGIPSTLPFITMCAPFFKDYMEYVCWISLVQSARGRSAIRMQRYFGWI